MRKLAIDIKRDEEFRKWFKSYTGGKLTPESLKNDPEFFTRVLEANIRSLNELEDKIEATDDIQRKARLQRALMSVKKTIENLKKYEDLIRLYSGAAAAKERWEDLFKKERYNIEIEKFSDEIKKALTSQINNKLRELRTISNSLLDAIATFKKFASVTYSTDYLITITLCRIACLEEKLNRL